MLTVGRGIQRRLASAGVRRHRGASYLPQAVALFSAMTTQPDATRKALINSTIRELINAGIWSELDELWFLASHAEQAGLLGWKRYKNCVAVNAPTFTVDRGFAGNGSTSYLNSQLVPSTDAVKFTLNNASFGVYSRTDVVSDRVDIGASDGSLNNSARLGVLVSGNQLSRINSASASSIASSVANSTGLAVARRTSGTAVQNYRNGASVGAASLASTAVPAFAMFIGGLNAGGSFSTGSPRELAFAFVGASMAAQQQLDLYNIAQAYMTAIGANV